MVERTNDIKTGPPGLANGYVDVQKEDQGRTPWRATSRMIRVWPIAVARMFPIALMATRAGRTRAEAWLPNTFSKNNAAVRRDDVRISSLGTAL